MRELRHVRWLGTLAALPAVFVAAEAGFACAPQPYLLIRPLASAAAGTEVTLDGHLFDSGTRIEIRWNATDGPLLGTAQTADFAVPVTIPQSPAGLYTLVAVSRNPSGVQGGVARASFQVNEPGGGTTRSSTPVSSPTPSSASNTGVSFTSVAASVALLAVGGLGGGAIMSRRRPKLSSRPPSSDPTI